MGLGPAEPRPCFATITFLSLLSVLVAPLATGIVAEALVPVDLPGAREGRCPLVYKNVHQLPKNA
jgi:hypothetical protein